MQLIDMIQVMVFFLVVLLCVKPLGWFIEHVYENKPCGLNQLGKPLEYGIYRLAHIDPYEKMDWKAYLKAILCFNFLGILLLYALQRLQVYLPFNPQHLFNVTPDLAFNTAISYVTNTNWQAYSGESTMSYLTQMLGLTVQNFLSAATGMSVLMALIRGIRNTQSSDLGNFWVDALRSILYILLPLSFIFSLILVSQGAIQNLKPYEIVTQVNEQAVQIPMGPVASQVAIKQLGSNGGGFLGANSAHPFENPSPLSNFLEMLAILLIPAALCYTFGLMVNDKKQGWALLGVMLMVAVVACLGTILFEAQGNPALTQTYANELISLGGNMEGKETRFGVVNSGLWASLTTATSNGSTNSVHNAYTPLGGLIPLALMHLGEVIFGGVGCGLYGMLIFVILAIFMAGLMVGRTPEYLGKKIGPFEMKMATVAVLVMPLIVLLFTAIAVLTQKGEQAGAHGLSQILYAFTSMVNNNGSAFNGWEVNTLFYNTLGGIAMLMGRFGVMIPVLAIAGSLSKKKATTQSVGTLETHSSLFSILLIMVILILGALSFFPILALGPIVEHLILWGKYSG